MILEKDMQTISAKTKINTPAKKIWNARFL